MGFWEGCKFPPVKLLGLSKSKIVLGFPLFMDKMISKKVAAFPEEGMEALYEIEVKGFPAIIASVNGRTIFSGD